MKFRIDCEKCNTKFEVDDARIVDMDSGKHDAQIRKAIVICLALFGMVFLLGSAVFDLWVDGAQTDFRTVKGVWQVATWPLGILLGFYFGQSKKVSE
jgi:hypothetical protein